MLFGPGLPNPADPEGFRLFQFQLTRRLKGRLFSGTKCPQTLPLLPTRFLCNSARMNEFARWSRCPPPTDQSDSVRLVGPFSLQPALLTLVSTLVFQLTLTLPATYGKQKKFHAPRNRRHAATRHLVTNQIPTYQSRMTF